MVKRYDETLEVSVFKYDLMRPIDWGQDIDDELRKQNDLWNKLCQIERNHVAAVREVGSSAAAGAEARAAALSGKIEEHVVERRTRRKEARAKVATPDLDAAIETYKKELKALRETAKAQRKEAYAANKDALKALDTERYAKVKEAYQNSGLWWPNYNAVIASYDRARGAALKKGHELKERYFNGEGRLTNQIQGGMTVGKLLDGTHSQVQLAPKPAWMRAAHHLNSGTTREKKGYTLRVCVYTKKNPDTGKTERRMLSFPLILYRPLPQDALIKEVVVTRRKMADRFTYSVIFTLTKKRDELPVPTGMPVAINFGWRKTDETTLRVATAVRFAENPLPGRSAFDAAIHTEITGKLLHGFDEYADMQSERDNAKNALVQKLHFTASDIPEAMAEVWFQINTSERVKPGTLIYLYRLWRDRRDWHTDLFYELQNWYLGTHINRNVPEWKQELKSPAVRVKQLGERKVHREQANRRRWLDDARLYHYRMEARRLVGDASLVILNEHDMSQTARTDANLPPPARRNRFVAAPSKLRQAIINYCKKHGVEVRLHKGSSKTHSDCGQEFSAIFPDERQQLCTHCHVYFDVDENYCRSMLRQAAIPPKARAA